MVDEKGIDGNGTDSLQLVYILIRKTKPYTSCLTRIKLKGKEKERSPHLQTCPGWKKEENVKKEMGESERNVKENDSSKKRQRGH